MTRILRIITSADPATGGPIEGARLIGEVLARQGHRQDMLTLDPPHERHLPDYPGRIIPIGPPRGRGLRDRYRYSATMVPWLHAHAGEYDAVIVSGLWRYAARGAMRALAGGAVPYFVFPHGMLDPWFREGAALKHAAKQFSWWWAEGALLACARAVLFTSEEEMRRANGAFWPYRAHGRVVSYGAADPPGEPAEQIAAFRATLSTLGGQRFLLFLGRIHPKKGCDMLVSAFAGIAASDPTLDLVIAGPDQLGLKTALMATAEQSGIAGRVHFPGMLTGAAKLGAYRAAEAFVLPSHQENFGIAVAEALSCATPVLISDRVNIWREVEADGAGYVAPATVEGTAELLRRHVATPPAERIAMRARARTCFENRFRVEQAAEDLLNLIR